MKQYQIMTKNEILDKLQQVVSKEQVNKWLKGKENFTFETIARIEDALNIELMSVPTIESTNLILHV